MSKRKGRKSTCFSLKDSVLIKIEELRSLLDEDSETPVFKTTVVEAAVIKFYELYMKGRK